MQTESLDTWGVVELLGHVRMAGRVTEEQRFGGTVGRLDVPIGDGFATTYFGAGSLYRLSIVSEEVARSVAARNKPEPVHQWELPEPDMVPVYVKKHGDDEPGLDVDDDDQY